MRLGRRAVLWGTGSLTLAACGGDSGDGMVAEPGSSGSSGESGGGTTGDPLASCADQDEPSELGSDVHEHACAPVDGGRIDELVAWLATATRDELFEGAAQRLASGLTIDEFTAAIYVAQITLWHDGDEHRRIVIPSARVLADMPAEHPPMLALMWCLSRNHRTSIGSSICPAPQVEPDPDPTALEQIRAALEAGDKEAADAAVVAALRGRQLAAVRDVMLEYGASNHEWIGHTMIQATQAARVLAGVGGRGAEPILRALVRSIAAGPDLPLTASYYENRERIAAIPEAAGGASFDEGAALELLAHLRDADASSSAEATATMLIEGVDPSTIWEATRLAAAELTLRFSWPAWIKFPIHAVTSNNGMRVAYAMTCDTRLRRLLLLQAASWISIHRDHAQSYNPTEPAAGWAIDTLEPEGDPSASLEEILAHAGVNRREGVRHALAWLREGGDPLELQARALELDVRATFEEHELKHPVAAFEEAAVAQPRFADVMWASGLAFGSEPDGAKWNGHDEAVAALGRLG